MRYLSVLLTSISLKAACLLAPALAADEVVSANETAMFDMGFELTGATDYMDVGLTNSDHNPSFSLTLTPSYGIFYGEFYIANIDYGTPKPKFEARWLVGATPEFGNLALDVNLERKMKFGDPSASRWVPYVTGTYTLSENFDASLGAGYYAYDDASVADFYELYAGTTYTLATEASLTSEIYWQPDSDGANNAYFEAIGTVSVPFAEKFEAVGKLGYEGYEDTSIASYAWYEAAINYNFNDHLVLGVGYHGSSMSEFSPEGDKCLSQAYTDCEDRVFARLTLKTNWSDFAK